MSTHKLLLCLGIVFLFGATAPVSAAPATDSTTMGVTITAANEAATTTSMRPKKKAKKAKKRGGKGGCEAYNS